MLSSILYCDHVSIDWLSKLCSFKPLVFATRDSLYVFWSIFGPWLPNDWMSELGVKKWLISTSSANWLCPNLAAGCPHPHRENGLKPSQRILRLRTAKTLCVKCWTLAKINTSNPDLYSCPCWFRVEGSQGAQKYPHPYSSLSRKNNSHPNSSSSQVSESSISGGGREVEHK